jgi:eukaryotic-like serine/threonine-protein kinase
VGTLLARGATVVLHQAGIPCEVREFLGAGGQGEVYRVHIHGSDPYVDNALKWYFPHAATEVQRKIITELLDVGAPDGRFLWPLDLASCRGGPSGFGYVMPLRESAFHGLVDLMNGHVAPSFKALSTAAYGLADSFLRLHALGYCYRDISFGNVFFDPRNGRVLICDNDNVGVDGRTPPTVSGTSGFMAPEVMRREAFPSTTTDLFSLAVLLFLMLFVHHPLLGRRELDEPSLDPSAQFRLYAVNPTFIFDPEDDSNAPVEGHHDNALIYWKIYPAFIRSLFTRAFTEGLTDPHSRVRESEWRLAMVQLRDLLMHCPSCTAECFFDPAVRAVPPCWRCGETAAPPLRLVFTTSSDVVILDRGGEVHRHHLGAPRYQFDEPVGSVVEHPSNPRILGLRNQTRSAWTATTASGLVRRVDPGRSIALMAGTRLDFGGTEATVES